LSDQQKETVEILAVSVDPDEQIQMMLDRISEEDSIVPDYTFLTDSSHQVIDRYGLFNPDEPRHRPVPHPTTLVIDREGVIRWRFTEVNYRVRPTNEDILAALAQVEGS
jgi:peroxiredoxin